MHNMTDYAGTRVTIIGASRGIGRNIAERFHDLGGEVLAVARGKEALDDLARDLPGMRTLQLDASLPDAAAKVLAAQSPDILILCAGAPAPCVPFQDTTWESFSGSWNTDMAISYNFLKASLVAPLPDGTTVVTITSGAMLGGSPISGGYAGAKKMQMFLSGYAQKEAGRAGLNLRFLTLAPLRIVPNTGVGSTAIAGYALYNAVTEAEFLAGLGPILTGKAVTDALLKVLVDGAPGAHYGVAPEGVSALS
jgi:NAD(P)-dependent dehydrogenase (short-subunit alcohol dehydrogenase family)